MKRLLFFALIMVCSVSWANWTLVEKNTEFLLFVDKSTIRKNGNIVKMWSMKDFAFVQTSGVFNYSSAKILDVYDCKEEAVAVVAISAYEGAMGNGKVVTTENYQQREWNWTPVYPNSIGTIQWKIACGKQ